MEIGGHGEFIVAVSRAGRLSCAAVVGCDDQVSCIGQGSNDMAELVGCLREPVDEEDSPFRLCSFGRGTGDVVYGDFCWCRRFAMQELASGCPAGGVVCSCCHDEVIDGWRLVCIWKKDMRLSFDEFGRRCKRCLLYLCDLADRCLQILSSTASRSASHTASPQVYRASQHMISPKIGVRVEVLDRRHAERTSAS